MNLTTQQAAFVQALLTSSSNLALVARAGCGKTWTILQGVAAYLKANPRHEVAVCAYNKPIATEVEQKLQAAGFETQWTEVNGRRVPPRVVAATVHRMGYSLVRMVFKGVKLDDKKVHGLVDELADGLVRSGNADMAEVAQQFRSQIITLVGLAKSAAVGYFDDMPVDNDGTWYGLADHFDVDGLEDPELARDIVQLAKRVYKASLARTDVIDFDDMILFPLIKRLRTKFGKDLLFVDEAQDLSRARQALLRKFVKPGTGRMVVVGDDRQAIYGFSGADAEALPNLIRDLRATVLPLSVTWRCPKAVVARAQALVPDIEAADAAPAGVVQELPEVPLDQLTATDAVLCRNTAPLIALAYSLIRKGTPCKVEGRDIGEGMVRLANRWKVKTIAALLNKLEQYKEREVAKAEAKGNDRKAEQVEDQVQTLVEICNACLDQGKQSVADVVAFIDNLFADGVEDMLTLATYHRSKGREWPHVVLYEHSARCPSPRAKQPWQLQQEDNLAYVAITRSKGTLTFAG